MYVIVEMRAHHVKLCEIEIPADRAADHAAEQHAQRIGPPGARPLAQARRHVADVAKQDRADIGQRAKGKAEQEALQTRRSRQTVGESQGIAMRCYVHLLDYVYVLLDPLAFATGLPTAAGLERFLFGFAFGALAYVGAILFGDIRDMASGLRKRPRSWRPYALGVALGGVVGGAVAWYLDAGQVENITVAKFFAYHVPPRLRRGRTSHHRICHSTALSQSGARRISAGSTAA